MVVSVPLVLWACKDPVGMEVLVFGRLAGYVVLFLVIIIKQSHHGAGSAVGVSLRRGHQASQSTKLLDGFPPKKSVSKWCNGFSQ